MSKDNKTVSELSLNTYAMLCSGTSTFYCTPSLLRSSKIHYHCLYQAYLCLLVCKLADILTFMSIGATCVDISVDYVLLQVQWSAQGRSSWGSWPLCDSLNSDDSTSFYPALSIILFVFLFYVPWQFPCLISYNHFASSFKNMINVIRSPCSSKTH